MYTRLIRSFTITRGLLRLPRRQSTCQKGKKYAGATEEFDSLEEEAKISRGGGLYNSTTADLGRLPQGGKQGKVLGTASTWMATLHEDPKSLLVTDTVGKKRCKTGFKKGGTGEGHPFWKEQRDAKRPDGTLTVYEIVPLRGRKGAKQNRGPRMGGKKRDGSKPPVID